MQPAPDPITTPTTGIPAIDGTLRILGLVYVILTILATLAPAGTTAAKWLGILALDLRRLFTPTPPAPPTAGAGKAAGAAVLCLALGAVGCTPAQSQPITSVVVAATCDLIEILDPALVIAAEACASAQPTVVNIIDAIIADLGPRKRSPEAVSLHLVPVDLGPLGAPGVTVLVRADLSVAFRAEVAKRAAAQKVAAK